MVEKIYNQNTKKENCEWENRARALCNEAWKAYNAEANIQKANLLCNQLIYIIGTKRTLNKREQDLVNTLKIENQ